MSGISGMPLPPVPLDPRFFQQGPDGLLGESSAADANTAESKNQVKARKRTKTGCMTCRKRRIKCGEERPTCANCSKSKRECEGYAPRLTFRDPMNHMQGWPEGMIPYDAQQTHMMNQYPPGFNSSHHMMQPGQLPAILPRPEVSPPMYSNQQFQWSPDTDHRHSGYSTSSYSSAPLRTGSLHHSPIYHGSVETSPIDQQMMQHQHAVVDPNLQVLDFSPVHRNSVYQTGPPANVAQWNRTLSQPVISSNFPPQMSVQIPPSAQVQPSTVPATPSSMSSSMHSYHGHPGGPHNVSQEHNIGSYQTAATQSMPQFIAPAWSGKMEGHPHDLRTTAGEEDGHIYSGEHVTGAEPQVPSALLFTHAPKQDLVPIKKRERDDSDEDCIMTDDEEHQESYRAVEAPHNDIGLMLAMSASRDGTGYRSYHTFLDGCDTLAYYQPRFTASPLMDSVVARIFCHYITATAPSLCMFERFPVNPSIIFSGKAVPRTQQGVWTYILPMLALQNQALLQSMLALASLQIAYLQDVPPTSSLRHYHFALRRIGKAVATPSRRTKVATIAATLILSHYEAMTAEHTKWSSHLAGATQLLMEVDFKGMTSRIRSRNARMALIHVAASKPSDRDHDAGQGYKEAWSTHEFNSYSNESSVDENLVSHFMGWKIRYEQNTGIVDDDMDQIPLTEQDIETYNTQSDLFWWARKQDIIASSISGNRLLLAYERWSHCPPRGPFGNVNAVYATMDHLLLLMGRVCEFAHKDQLRKRKVIDANGGRWQPPSGMFKGRPPGSDRAAAASDNDAKSSQPPTPQGNIPPGGQTSAQIPSFYGMMPMPSNIRMPDAFYDAPKEFFSLPAAAPQLSSLDVATAAATTEWNEIQAALSLFESSLGPGWQPMGPDITAEIPTAFGPALQYRSYSMAIVWATWHTARIILARTHPTMPPAATMAMGIAAAQTAASVNAIGRIVFGIQAPPEEQPIPPSLGAALGEAVVSMFFAGVQYTDPMQRAVTIDRLRLVARRTGLQSASLIAAGCETTWLKMAESGRGPPYERVLELATYQFGDPRNKRHAQLAKTRDRGLVYVQPGIRSTWGMGVMGLEEDFREMALVRRDNLQNSA